MAAILILGDEAIDRKFLATLLKSAGHSVTEASDGVEGLRLAQQAHPDLVISDILMPTFDGLEFVRRLRRLPGLAQTRVIFYTATYHQREARTLAQQCGVVDILNKGSEPAAILAKVDAALASARQAGPSWHDPPQVSRDHLRAVSQALESKIEDFEANEHRMAAIVGLAQQIAVERDPSVLLDKLCVAAREVTLAQQAIVMMLTGDRSAFRRVVASGIAEEILSRTDVTAVNGPVFNRAITERQPVTLRNPDGRPEAIGLPENHPPTYSSLVVPIASASLVHGCLWLRNKLGADAFSDRDEEVALTLATHAGIVYQNARLVDDLRKRTATLEQEVADRGRAAARTQLALTAARMGVWEFDVAADRFDWSGSMTAIFGLPPAQAPTTSNEFMAVIHPEDRAAARESFERAIRDGTDIVNEFRTVWPDGSMHRIAGRARVLRDNEGSPSRLIGVGMDIGERRSLEDQLRQAQKIEREQLLAQVQAIVFKRDGGIAAALLDCISRFVLPPSAESKVQPT